jgi:hypothetical protein
MGIVEKIFDVEYQVINKVREKIEVGNVTVILMSVEQACTHHESKMGTNKSGEKERSEELTGRNFKEGKRKPQYEKTCRWLLR